MLILFYIAYYYYFFFFLIVSPAYNPRLRGCCDLSKLSFTKQAVSDRYRDLIPAKIRHV